jgi:TRAP-type C4-dicarboxylate transport system substrate-binding protein
MPKFARIAVSAAIASLIATAAPRAAEIELKAVAGLPAQSVVTQVFLNWVKGVNERGKGLVQIKFSGAGEITPVFQQAAAIKRGLFDVLYTPGAFYAGANKHVDALLASNVPIETMRKNGAMKELEDLWAKQLGVHALGWFDTHVSFSLFLGANGKFNMPKQPADLKNMLKGVKMWTTPTFRELLSGLGATPVAMAPTDILPALDKGVIQGYGYPEYGIVGMGLERATKTVFLPTYYRGNTMALVNMRKWKSLPENVKSFLTKEALAYETASKAFIRAGVDKETAILKKEGAKFVTLPGEVGKAYRRLASKVAWDRLAKRAPKEAPKLRKLMYDPALD